MFNPEHTPALTKPHTQPTSFLLSFSSSQVEQLSYAAEALLAEPICQPSTALDYLETCVALNAQWSRRTRCLQFRKVLVQFRVTVIVQVIASRFLVLAAHLARGMRT